MLIRSSSLLSLFALLLSCFSQSSAQPLQCSFSNEIALNEEGTVFLQQFVNRQEGTYSVRLRYTEGYSWIGIGINYYDDAIMVPAYSVIGREENDGSLSVARYWLERTFVTGILPIEDPNEHLKAGASLVQENGETILEFTHDLVILEDGIVYENVTNDSTWIWAVGPEDNDWGIRHTLQGSFSLELSDTCVDATAPATNPNDDLHSDLPWDADDNLKGNQTNEATSDTVIVFNESQSRVSRGLWITHGLFMAFAWGILAPLAIGASLFRNFGFLKKDALWFKLHMYSNFAVAFLTFVGFFLAVRATNKEGGQSHFKDDSHHKVGLTIFFFVFAQCLLGYFRPAKEKASHAAQNEEDQPEVIEKEVNSGDEDSKQDSETVLAEPELDMTDKLAVSSPDDEKPKTTGTNEDEQGFEMDVAEISAFTEATNDEEAANEEGAINEDSSASLSEPPPPLTDTPPLSEDGKNTDEGQEIEPVLSKQEVDTESAKLTFVSSMLKKNPEDLDLREYWKYAHRIMGMVLIALAWFNCHTGIELFTAKYSADNEQQLLNLFWGLTGTIAVVFLFQGYVLRE